MSTSTDNPKTVNLLDLTEVDVPKRALVLTEKFPYSLQDKNGKPWALEEKPVPSVFNLVKLQGKKTPRHPSYIPNLWYSPLIPYSILFNPKGEVIDSIHPDLVPFNGASLKVALAPRKAIVTIDVELDLTEAPKHIKDFGLDNILSNVKSAARKMANSLTCYQPAIPRISYTSAVRNSDLTPLIRKTPVNDKLDPDLENYDDEEDTEDLPEGLRLQDITDPSKEKPRASSEASRKSKIVIELDVDVSGYKMTLESAQNALKVHAAGFACELSEKGYVKSITYKAL